MQFVEEGVGECLVSWLGFSVCRGYFSPQACGLSSLSSSMLMSAVELSRKWKFLGYSNFNFDWIRRASLGEM